MSIPYIIFCVSLAICSSISKMCLESVPTVSVVPRCPSNAKEWVSAAKQKSCNELGRIQTCTNPDKFVYHCVLNKQGTQLLEVCAPTWFLTGYCARFSEEDKGIINDPDLDCTKFDSPCPTRFLSNESYKYQTCYQKIGQKSKMLHLEKDGTKTTLTYVFLAIFAITTIVLLILLCSGWKMKRKHIRSKKTNKGDSESEKEIRHLIEDETSDHISNSENPYRKQSSVDSETIEYKSLSGVRQGCCSLKGISTVGDVLDALSRKLDIQRQFLSIVDTTTGQILNEEDLIKHLHITCIELMIGNENRNNGFSGKDGGNVETDVIDNKKLTGGKCQMSCGHFTAPDSLFNYAMKELPCSSDPCLQCPGCKDKEWNVDELVTKCNMSPDEKLFFYYVVFINKRTDDLKREYKNYDSMPCLSNLDPSLEFQTVGPAKSLSEL